MRRYIFLSLSKTNINMKREGERKMADMTGYTKEMNEYFDSLPKFLQESIIQSGTKVKTLNELRGFSKEICQKGFGKKQ